MISWLILSRGIQHLASVVVRCLRRAPSCGRVLSCAAPPRGGPLSCSARRRAVVPCRAPRAVVRSCPVVRRAPSCGRAVLLLQGGTTVTASFSNRRHCRAVPGGTGGHRVF